MIKLVIEIASKFQNERSLLLFEAACFAANFSIFDAVIYTRQKWRRNVFSMKEFQFEIQLAHLKNMEVLVTT